MKYTTQIVVEKGNPKAFFESLLDRKAELKKYVVESSAKKTKPSH